MLDSVTIAAPVLLPIMSFGIVIYFLLRGQPAVRYRAAASGADR